MHNEKSVDCNECMHMPINENAQDRGREECGEIFSHFCVKFKEVCKHNGRHPLIQPCDRCKGKYFEKGE